MAGRDGRPTSLYRAPPSSRGAAVPAARSIPACAAGRPGRPTLNLVGRRRGYFSSFWTRAFSVAFSSASASRRRWIAVRPSSEVRPARIAFIAS